MLSVEIRLKALELADGDLKKAQSFVDFMSGKNASPDEKTKGENPKTAKKHAPKKSVPKKEKPKSEGPSTDEVRAALLNLQKETDRETAKGVINQFTETPDKFSGIPAEKYADVIAACKKARG